MARKVRQSRRLTDSTGAFWRGVVWQFRFGRERRVEVCQDPVGWGVVWQSRRGTMGSGVDGFGRKFAEDWKGNVWHGKLGFGSRGGDWNDARGLVRWGKAV